MDVLYTSWKWRAYGIFRLIWFLPHHVYCVLPYFVWIALIQPLFYLWENLYWLLEGYLFKWLLAMIGAFAHFGGYTLYEEGDDVRQCINDKCLIMCNHQCNGDVPVMMLAVQDKGPVCRRITWIMDVMFKYSHFGLVSQIHGDIFVESGKAAKEQSLVHLKHHLENIYLPRERQWLALFPEGGYLRNMKPGSQRYAQKNGYPILENVALPRVGAMEAILVTLQKKSTSNLSLKTNSVNGHTSGRKDESLHVTQTSNDDPAIASITNTTSNKLGSELKWIVDITIAYPEGKLLDNVDFILCRRAPTEVRLYYRIYPIDVVPIETTALTKWLNDRFAEKDRLLDEYYRTGRFPAAVPEKSYGRVLPRPRTLDIGLLWYIGLQFFWLGSMIGQYYAFVGLRNSIYDLLYT